MALSTPAGTELSHDQLLKLYRDMLTQRAADTRGFQLNRQGKIGIAMGSEGHEAVQAGTGLAFERGRDLLYPYYRNTGIILACGFPLVDLFRSQLARARDTTGGRSIINHVTARALGIASISSIIAAQCTHAVGAAWKLKYRGEHDRVVFCQFGDGVRALGRDDRGDRGDPERARGDVVDDRAAAGRVPRARQLRAKQIDQREAAGEDDAGVAVVRVEQIAAALEREPGPRLDRFVTLRAHRDPDLPLAVELEAARVDRALREHVAVQLEQLIVGEFGAGRGAERHRREPSAAARAPLPSGRAGNGAARSEEPRDAYRFSPYRRRRRPGCGAFVRGRGARGTGRRNGARVAAKPAPKPAVTSSPGPDTDGVKFRAIGPAVSGGRIGAVAGSDRDPALYYAGGAGGGVFKSSDGGSSFQPVWDAASKFGAIGAIAVAPSDDKTVWVGTGEAAPRNDVSYGDGVWLTRDGAKHWTHAGLSDTALISKILVDPKNPRRAIVGALGDPWKDSPARGVYVTADGGRSWSKTLYVGPASGAADLAWNPKAPSTVFAAIWQFRRQPWIATSGGAADGLYRSRDGGRTWAKIQGHGFPTDTLGRIGVAVAPSDPRRVYAVVQSKQGTIWRSDDGGDTWRRVSSDTTPEQRPFYFTHLGVYPRNKIRVIAVFRELKVH